MAVMELIKERPILFSAPMVRAILNGQKTQTRRVVKPQPEHLQIYDFKGKRLYEGEHRLWCWDGQTVDQIYELAELCPYGKPGERLWVRETFRDPDTLEFLCYKASEDELPDFINTDNIKWKPSIFMPRRYSRITLEVVSVRVERLQDIGYMDCKAEGTEDLDEYQDAIEHAGAIGVGTGHIGQLIYANLWEKINGKGSWEKNPWVWVVEFKKL